MPTIQWYKASFEDEFEEFEALGKRLGIPYARLREAYSKVRSPKPLVQSVWATLENTDSWRVKSFSHLSSLLGAYQKPFANFGFLLDAIFIKRKCPLPIIVGYIDKNGNQKQVLAAGNTRLCICRIAKIQPRALFLDLILTGE